MHDVAPATEVFPSGHVVQDPAPAALKVPEGHLEHVLLSEEDAVPAVQAMHDVAPEAAAIDPAGHAVQDVAPDEALKVPGLHLIHVVPERKEPAAQFWE